MDFALTLGIIVIKIAVVFGIVLFHVAYATYFERKIIGRMQARHGPMEVGPHGLLQPFADIIKLFFKEDIVPSHADRWLFYIAPAIVVISSMTALSVLPFFEGFVIADINIGLLFILVITSISVYGIVIAGWSSNSKYSFLGGLRSAAQLISYEIAMGLSLVGVILMAGSMNLSDIVKAQHQYPLGMFAFPQFLGFFVFVVAAFAETNRAPFDLPEAEQELVAGYFTEYSGFRFALFFLGEYIAMLTMSIMVTLCFLGGWTIPLFMTNALPFLSYVPGIVWFLMKVYAFMFLFYWIRATLPRYRYDQLMAIGWKVLIPLSFANVLITAFIMRWL